MAGITGMGTTFNLPNFQGQLFGLTPAATPFLSAIGGLTGGGMVMDTEFEWQTYDLRAGDQRTRLEGAVAPTAEGRVRAQVKNVCQIHQEKIEVSYTKQAAVGRFNGLATDGGGNPVADEVAWQTEQMVKQVALDVNWSFINGRYQLPVDNTTARRTRGMLEAITTNTVYRGTNVATGASSATTVITPVAAHSLAVNDRIVFSSVGTMTNVRAGQVYLVQAVTGTTSFSIKATPAGAAITVGTSTANINYHSLGTTALDLPTIENFVMGVFDNGGLEDGSATLVVNSYQRNQITRVFADAYGKATPVQGTLGGVVVDTIATGFGTFNIMVDRAVPQDTILLATMSQITPVLLNIPGKGVFFVEDLAQTGASMQKQLYGEIGLAYGSQLSHGALRGLPVA